MQCAVAQSSDPDPQLAIAEIASQVSSKLGPARPDLVIGFASVAYEQERTAALLKEKFQGSIVTGCSDAGGITAEGPVAQGIAVLAVRSERMKFTLGLGENIGKNIRQAGIGLGNDILQKGGHPSLLISLADGLAGNGADLIRGIQARLGKDFPIVGGSAGDDFLFKKTFEYFEGKALTGAVIGIGISGDFKFGIGVRHGWVPIGVQMKATRSKGAVISKIDNKPAVSVYEDYFGEQKALKLREEPLARLAITYPLGIKTNKSDEYLIRDPISVDEDGAITCAAEIPEGSDIRLMIGSKEDAIEAARQAARQAVSQMAGKEVKLAMIFNCIARYKLLGRDAKKEIDAIREVVGERVPLFGFYTYGEHAPLPSELHGGPTVFHNETAVILTIG